jgi:transcriptional regulator with XRE-family HTH domain
MDAMLHKMHRRCKGYVAPGVIDSGASHAQDRGMKRRPHYLRTWRELRGLTQEEVGVAIGKHKSIVSKLENFRVAYTQEHLELLAMALGCEPADLLRPPSESPAADLLDVVRALKGEKRKAALAMLRGLARDAA